MSYTNPSKIRIKAYNIANNVYLIGRKYVKHKTIFTFFDHFFKPRLDRIILYEATEADLKTVLLDIKKEIDSLFKEIDLIEQIKDKKLNDIKLEKMPGFDNLLKEYGF